jgi:hypothetical protein
MPIPSPAGVWAAIGSASSGRNRKTLSTVAAPAVGLARSSEEARVMRGERRGWTIWVSSFGQPE